MHFTELRALPRVRLACSLSSPGTYDAEDTCAGSTPCGWQYACNLDGSCIQAHVPAGTPAFATQTDCLNQCRILKAVKCDAALAEIYHANTATKVLRWYSPDTYASWGQPLPQVIDCTGYTYDAAMPMKT